MIPVFKPAYGPEEVRAVEEVFRSGWIGLGPKTKAFEDKFAEYLGVKHAVGLDSCTAALHLALKVVGVENSEVISTPMTFVSTNMAILYNNATPVFADVESDTLNIDVEDVRRKITPKTKAIIVVHYGGYACDMEGIIDLAKRHNLAVIEDCAHACGGKYKDIPLGSLGDVGCFSFHAVKNLATGDGGMISTNNDAYDERLRKLRWLGISKDTWKRSEISTNYSWYYTVEEVGYKCHMNDIIASLGIVQLSKLDENNRIRKSIAQKYNLAFEGLEWLQCPVEKDYMSSSHHNYVVKVKDRDAFMEHLTKAGIASSVHYFPNHLYEIFSSYRVSLPVADEIWKSIVTLPLFPTMSDADIDHVIQSVCAFTPAGA